MGGERKCKGSVKEERGRGEREKESREKREKKRGSGSLMTQVT